MIARSAARRLRRRDPLERRALAPLREDRLYFAQVREDSRLDVEALRPAAHGRYVVVSSGGCTLLSLVAAGAGEVVGVDLNPTQNHLVELKAAAATLGGADALAFLGGAPMHPWARESRYLRIRDLLGPEARAYWERRRRAVRAGVLGAGVTERFLRAIAWIVRHLVHTPARVRALLACETLDQQRAFFDASWNNRRWRLLFRVLTNRLAMSRTYHPAFFRYVENPSFSAHFSAAARHGLTELPVADNYFLRYLFEGRYPADVAGGLPLYLEPRGLGAVAGARDRLSLADGGLLEYLRTQPASSFDGFSLSNIAEWMDETTQAALFAEIARTARPGARLCLRNFLGWTEVPARVLGTVDEALGEALSARDRSLVQRRIVVGIVRKREGQW